MRNSGESHRAHPAVGAIFPELGIPFTPELRLLILAEQAADTVLAERSLHEAGMKFSFISVANRDAFAAELRRQTPDLILSDHSTQGHSREDPLEIAGALAPGIPVILLVDALFEEGIELLKQGAADLVLRTRPARLASSVRRALREAGARRDHERADSLLRDSHTQLRALANSLNAVREEERTRIARQVHDVLGQALTGLKLELAALPGKPGGARGLKAGVKSMSVRIDEMIGTVRQIATDLRPGILDSLGLAAAIEWLAEDFQARTGVPCTATIDVRSSPLSPTLSTAVFRICQEALTNVTRHANATRVDLRLTQSYGHLILTVRDNGRGISENEINSLSIGLVGMKERAVEVGGEVFIFGMPSHGTTVIMKVPLDAAAAPAAGHPAQEIAT
jgi:signal transduction histidine kinase